MKPNFSKALLFWTLHGAVCATPCVVLAFMGGYNTAPAFLGMFLGTASLILLYTAISTSERLNVFTRKTILNTSIKRAAHLRATVSAVGIFGLSWPDSALIALNLVEMYCGALAVGLMALIFPSWRLFKRDAANVDPSFWFNGPHALFPTALTTVITGLLWSVQYLLLVLVFVLVWKVAKRIGTRTANCL